jgi:hypothetical protein
MCFCSSPGIPKNRKEEIPRETLLVSFGTHCGADVVSIFQGMTPYKPVNHQFSRLMRVPEDWDTKLLQNTVKCLPVSMCHISDDLNLQQHFLFITVYNGICMHHTPEYALTVNVWHLTTYRNVCACTCDYITSLHQVYIASIPKYSYGCCLLG